ncbi:MAG: hypothetical protein JWR77_1804 [Rhizorhabdus sp.]|nr:hypothetical protein [Rhizorhabdus sp.]
MEPRRRMVPIWHGCRRWSGNWSGRQCDGKGGLLLGNLTKQNFGLSKNHLDRLVRKIGWIISAVLLHHPHRAFAY